MDFDFGPYFAKYEKLVAAADAAFERVKQAHAECVKCAEGCADCCHAVFDLTLIEALYINHRFNQEFKCPESVDLEEKANKTDRLMAKIKRRAQEDLLSGKPEADILADLARERVRCPLLNTTDLCALYRYRPLTCRFYGIPTAIGSGGYTCGLSGFKEGETYPTVNLDAIHARLQEISAELIRDLQSRFIKLADILVPLSTALITEYDEAYFGLKETLPDDLPPKQRRSRRHP
ncbi:MAG: YkgJ family cysteine cluster protein [Desulfobacterales bacterium]|jgi:Fe-S-cluster containining protein|nr:YkgJ family cysteine cluster protein [Desulfobacterales bacterium]